MAERADSTLLGPSPAAALGGYAAVRRTTSGKCARGERAGVAEELDAHDDPDAYEAALADAFDAGAGERRAVARMAADLAATGRFAEVTDGALDPDAVVRNLADAPDEELASRWNWWLGSLEIAFGPGFAEFQVRRYESDDSTPDDRDATGPGDDSDDG